MLVETIGDVVADEVDMAVPSLKAAILKVPRIAKLLDLFQKQVDS